MQFGFTVFKMTFLERVHILKVFNALNVFFLPSHRAFGLYSI